TAIVTPTITRIFETRFHRYQAVAALSAKDGSLILFNVVRVNQNQSASRKATSRLRRAPKVRQNTIHPRIVGSAISIAGWYWFSRPHPKLCGFAKAMIVQTATP